MIYSPKQIWVQMIICGQQNWRFSLQRLVNLIFLTLKRRYAHKYDPCNLFKKKVVQYGETFKSSCLQNKPIIWPNKKHLLDSDSLPSIEQFIHATFRIRISTTTSSTTNRITRTISTLLSNCLIKDLRIFFVFWWDQSLGYEYLTWVFQAWMFNWRMLNLMLTLVRFFAYVITCF